MPINVCANNCGRLISISYLSGGNPIASLNPDMWATSYGICDRCKAMYCDRCVNANGGNCPSCSRKIAIQSPLPDKLEEVDPAHYQIALKRPSQAGRQRKPAEANVVEQTKLAEATTVAQPKPVDAVVKVQPKRQSWWRGWLMKKDRVKSGQKAKQPASDSARDRNDAGQAASSQQRAAPSQPTRPPDAPARVIPESDDPRNDQALVFTALFLADSKVLQTDLEEVWSGTGVALRDVWLDALRAFHAGDQRRSCSLLDELISKLSQVGLSASAVAGIVNQQYGMQLRIMGQIEDSLIYLRRAKQCFLDWIDQNEPEQTHNYGIYGIGVMVYRYTELVLGQLAYECRIAERYLEALECAEKGLQIAQKELSNANFTLSGNSRKAISPSPIAEFLFSVELAWVQYQLGEVTTAKEVYEQALNLAYEQPWNKRIIQGPEKYEKERYSFACWQLSKLAERWGENEKCRKLLATAARTCPAWIMPDHQPYSRQYQAEIGK